MKSVPQRLDLVRCANHEGLFVVLNPRACKAEEDANDKKKRKKHEIGYVNLRSWDPTWNGGGNRIIDVPVSSLLEPETEDKEKYITLLEVKRRMSSRPVKDRFFHRGGLPMVFHPNEKPVQKEERGNASEND